MRTGDELPHPEKTEIKNQKMKQILFAIALLWLAQSCKKNDVADSPHVTQNNIAAIDDRVIAWMNDNSMPGASLAVSVNGKLAYRKAYGLADENTRDSVTVDSRFRIASVSKLITSVAVLKLIEAGKFNIDDKVFGSSGLLGTLYGTPPYKQYVTDITVSNLLHHTSGGWGQDNDPSFWNLPSDRKSTIDLTLNTVPLTNAPGTKFIYSNFGYMLLAAIVEKVSGKTYEQFAADEIFSKTGMTKTETGGNTLAERKTGEVNYYGQGADVPYVYTMNLPRAVGAWNWISTPTDLLRFATAVDSFSTRPDIISPQTLQKMITTTPESIGWGWHFGCGWVVESGEWFWWGSLAGTFSILYRNNNGICIAAISNSRTQRPGSNGVKELNAFLDIINWISTDKTIAWQDIDQFK